MNRTIKLIQMVVDMDPKLAQGVCSLPKLAQVCSKAPKHGVLVRYNKPNFGYICIKKEQRI